MESAGGGTGTDALEDLGGDAGGVAARSPELALTVHVDRTREYLAHLTALVSVLAMNYLYTGRFFET